MKKLGKILLVLGLALLFAVPVFAQRTAAPIESARPSDVLAPSQAMTLTILHTNDVHAHVDEWDGKAGAARIATKVNEIRAAKDNVLLLDAGDQFQGTLFYNLFKADIITLTMNAIGYDAMTIGNHEFDDGPEELARLIDGADFPVVSANIDASAEPSLAGKIHPSTVITVAGEPVGIVGLITPETEELSSPGDVVFLDTVTSMQDAVDDLTDQGIDKIIALTHQGYSYDVELAEAVQDVDVIVGGHSHTYLHTPPGEDHAGPYPTVVNDVLIVQAGQWGEYLGHLDVVFDDAGVVSSYSGNPILMDDSITKTQEVEDIVAARRGAIEELKTTYVGTTTVDLPIMVSGQQICRMGECLMGNLVSDAMLWKMNDMVDTPYDIAIQNGGGLRAPLYAGAVSVGDVLEVLPFGNAIGTFEITGTHIISALEHGVSQVAYGAGRFPQVAGMRYTFALYKSPGSRILSAEVYNAATEEFEALDENKVYRVVTNDYMLGGGDGYDMFAEYAIDPYDSGPLLDAAVVEYFEEFSPVTPKIEGRVVLIPPEVVADPSLLSAEVYPDETISKTLTISNTAEVTRTWTLSDVNEMDWLTFSPISGTLMPAEVEESNGGTILLPTSVDVNVTFDATGMDEGVYTSTMLSLASNQPDAEEPFYVSVRLTVKSYERIYLPLVVKGYVGTVFLP